MDEITYCAGCDSGYAAVDSAGQLVLWYENQQTHYVCGCKRCNV